MQLEETIHEWMIHHKKTLALAESCTGGRLAARLTALAGASSYFLGSLVVYSNFLKRKLLGVAETTIGVYGAVSEEACIEMVQGILRVSDADYGLAIAGVAGPTTSDRKEIGTVWVAVGKKIGKAQVYCLSLKGSREEIMQKSAEEALKLLVRYLFDSN